MEDAFGFTETIDQLTAIQEVKSDMEKPVPMDRVICGDVGYGKTEIAVRAAFKAVQDGKAGGRSGADDAAGRSASADIHRTYGGLPVTVKGLSRFTDPAESRQDGRGHGRRQRRRRHRDASPDPDGRSLEGSRAGGGRRGTAFRSRTQGTHQGAAFHVDVLTMSATPIPRTLEMSLAGIREMSTILTPPEERYPVLTYVGPHDDKQVAAALRRELLRDGQAFYIHNRVNSIDAAAGRIRALVPEARVAVAHGQMAEDLLERTVGVLAP